MSTKHGRMYGRARGFAKATVKAMFPVLAPIYRLRPSAAPDMLLTALGVANGHRPATYTLRKIARTLDKFDGDVIECGVFQGYTLLGVAHELRKRGLSSVKLYGMDSFEGFPAPAPQDALGDGTFHERALQGTFGDTSYNRVWRKIRALGFSRSIELRKGFFDQTLPDLKDHRFSLAHLDCDLYQSYMDCLTFLYPRMVPGGYMVFDEYDYVDTTYAIDSVYPGARKAIDEFFADKPEHLERFDEAKVVRYFVRKV